MRRKSLFCLIGFVLGIIASNQLVENSIIDIEIFDNLYTFQIYANILFVVLIISFRPRCRLTLLILFCCFGLVAGILEQSKFAYDVKDIGHQKAEGVAINGQVLDIKKDVKRYKVVIAVIGRKNERNKKILIEYNKKDKNINNIHLGDRIQCITKNKDIKNSNEDSKLSYLKYQGIKFVVKADKLTLKKKNDELLYVYKNYLLSKRNEFYENLWNIDRKYRALIKTMIFGDRQELEKEEYKNMQRNGIAPILATSGLHLGILYAIVRYITVRFHYKYTYLVELGIIWSYGVLVGFVPSVLRVLIMLSTYILLKKKFLFVDLGTLICFACLFQLFFNPLTLYDIGFQFSYVGMFIIANLISIIKNFEITTCFQKIILFFAFPILIQFFMIPMTSYYFGYISFSGFISNLLCGAVGSLLIPCGMILFIFSIFQLSFFNKIFLFVLEKLSSLFYFLNDITYNDGKFVFDIDNIYANEIVGIYLLILFVTSEYFVILIKRRKYIKIIANLVGILGMIMI